MIFLVYVKYTQRVKNQFLARVFQSIRIEVNQELNALVEFLNQLPKVLKNEGIKQGVGALQDLMDNKEAPKKVLKRRAQSLGKAILKRIKPTPVSKPSHSTPKPRAKRTRRLRHRGFVKRRNLRARPLDIFD